MRSLDFTGTSYLALDRQPSFIRSIKEGIERYGTNFGGSRLSNSAPSLYREAEEFFASKLGFDDTAIVSSGTLAAILVARYLKEKNYKIFVSGDLHPALKSNFEHYPPFNNAGDILATLDKGTKAALLVDSINPVTLQHPSPEELNRIRNKDNFLLVVDDSHGIGVLGEQGWGIAEGLDKRNSIVVASLAKALALRGGIVAANKEIINSIKQMALWGGASPPPPFYFYAFLKNQKLLEKQKAKLKEITDYAARKNDEYGFFDYIPGFPVFINKGKSLYRELLAENIKISAFSYPKKDDPFVERIVLNASHLFGDIDILFETISKIRG